MASLLDTVKKNKSSQGLMRDASGQLVEKAVTPINSMASTAGVIAPPTTPAGVQALGGNQHQAKMAGTPAQKQSALTYVQQTGSPQDLATAQRRDQSQRAMTAEEQAGAQKARDMTKLETIPEKVNSAIQAQFNKLTSAQASLTPSTTAQLTPEQNTLLTQLQATPDNPELLAKVNKAFGRGAGTQMGATELLGLYKPSTEAIASTGAQAVGNDIKVSNLIEQGLQYTPAQLSGILGIPEADIGNMSVPELSNALSNLQQEQFSQVAESQRRAQSGLAGAAEQSALQQQQREFSTTGVRNIESQVADVDKAVESGQTVQFGDKSYSISELLSDDNVSDMISEYLNSPVGSDTRKNIDQTSPALSKFINDNQALLKAASDKMSATVTKLGEITKKNQQLATFGNTSIPKSIMDKILPESQIFSGKAVDVQSIPLLANIGKLGTKEQEMAVSQITDLVSGDDELADEISKLSPKELESLQLGKTNSKAIANIKDNRAFSKALSEIDLNDTDSVLSLLTGQPTSTKDIEGQLQKEKTLSALGLATGKSFSKTFDKNGDGKIDDIKSQVKSFLKPKSIKDLLSGASPSVHVDMPRPDDATRSGVESVLISSLGDAAKDGNVSVQELRTANIDDMGMRTLALGQDSLSGVLGGKDSETNKVLQNRIQSWRTNKSTSIMEDFKIPTSANVLKDFDKAAKPSEVLDKLGKSISQLESLVRVENFDKLYNSDIIKQRLGSLYEARDTMSKSLSDREKAEKKKLEEAKAALVVPKLSGNKGSTAERIASGTSAALQGAGNVVTKTADVVTAPISQAFGQVAGGITNVVKQASTPAATLKKLKLRL